MEVVRTVHRSLETLKSCGMTHMSGIKEKIKCNGALQISKICFKEMVEAIFGHEGDNGRNELWEI